MIEFQPAAELCARGVLRRILSAVFLCSVIGFHAGPAALASDQQPRFVDKGPSEEEQILQRNEWFFGSRRAGTSSDDPLWSLRLAGVQQTRQAIALQQQVSQTQEGGGPGQNVWVSKGPSPSTFGGWTFGNVSGRLQAIEADWQNEILYVGAAAGGVWKSTNDGLSWTNIFENAGTVAVGAIQVDPNDSSVLWVGTGDNIVNCESYFGIGMLRSTDGGATWEQRNGSGASTLDDLSSFANITVDPRDSNRIVTGGKYRGCSGGFSQAGGIYTTDDAGATWTNRLSNIEIHEIARDPASLDILWAATNQGIYKSVNNGVSWTKQTASGLPSSNTGRTEIAVAPSNPNTVYALFDGASDEFWRTTNGGTSWSLMNGDACDGQCWYNMAIRVSATDPDLIYRGTIKIFRSSNGGASWTSLTNNWGAAQQVHQDMHAILAHPTDPDTFYISGDGGLWKSTTQGNSFTNLNGNLNAAMFYAIDVDLNDPDRICGGAQDNSSLATEGNPVWDLQQVTGDGFVCAIDPLDPDFAYITSYPSGGYPNVWRSNSGLFGTFFDVTGSGSGISNGDRIAWVTPYAMDKTNPTILYLGTHRVYRTMNRGSDWTLVSGDHTGGGNSTLSDIEINRGFPSTVFSGSYSGKVWRTTNDGADWSDISAGLQTGRAVNDVAGDPADPDRAFAALGGFNAPHVWEWNAGSGWTARDTGLPNVPANTVLMLTSNDILVGTDTGVFRSADGGQSFVPYMAGLPEGLVVMDLKYNEQQSIVTAGTYGRGAWQVNVGAPAPLVEAESVVQPLIEVDGDGDAEIEPGETWSVRPILRNAGAVTAQNVTARLASATPGLTILEPDSGNFGNIMPGASAPSLTALRFAVDPSFECGSAILFDLMDLTSVTPPAGYPDQPGFYMDLVQGGNAPSGTTTLVDENFDPDPIGWTHESVEPSFGLCAIQTHLDEWNLASKDAAHGTSFHCGNGPGGTYGPVNAAWLHPFGKDSLEGPGILIPSTATAATLTLVHWYDTVAAQDGGQVVIDTLEDDQDVYTTLDPDGGYPATLNAGGCNPLEGQEAFQGSSGGWTTSLFDLTEYKGSRVYLAFVFGSDSNPAAGEGWYIDELEIEYQEMGDPICDIAPWPGVVPNAHFSLTAEETIEATWADSCNVGDFPGQTYSIQAGSLSALAAGSYTHAPVDSLCDLASPGTFTPGAGNEYYLVVPVGDGREGGAGLDSAGELRPQPGNVCGERRLAETCP